MRPEDYDKAVKMITWVSIIVVMVACLIVLAYAAGNRNG